MKQNEAEKLLGGHATGTLTEAERHTLFAAALEHQEVFDALMDEEALRELLADPAAKAQLLAALAAATAPRVVPFWRRTGVLGAAASLLMAATAGLVFLRSPEKTPPPLEQEAAKPSKAKAAEVPAPAEAPAVGARKTTLAEPLKETTTTGAASKGGAPPPSPPPPPPSPAQVAAPAAPPEDQDKAKADFRRAEAQANLAKKAEAPRPAAAALEVAASRQVEARERRAKAQEYVPGGVPGGVIGGVVGGVASGVAAKAMASDQVGKPREDAAPPPLAAAAPGPATAARRVEWKAAAGFAPSWILEPQADGSTRITVKGPKEAVAVLLRRGAAGVEVLTFKAAETSGPMAQWRTQIRLQPGDALDLYLLNAPVDAPAKLPATGPVDGYRARIHPPANLHSAGDGR